jgi:hypothetical protein
MKDLRDLVAALQQKNVREGCSVFTIADFCKQAFELIDAHECDVDIAPMESVEALGTGRVVKTTLASAVDAEVRNIERT